MQTAIVHPGARTAGAAGARPVASPILVTGGTGTLGRLVVARLREAGYGVRVLSRLSRREPEAGGADGEAPAYVAGDLSTGEGIDAAVAGVGVVVHCAGSARGDEDKARHLVRAAAKAGARHLVNVSVVGADRVPVTGRIDRAMFGYFASKRAAEEAVAGAGVPWTTLRATQFHDLIYATVSRLAGLPLIPVAAGFRFQPVDAGEVAARLTDLALGAPAGLVPDLAGPRVYEMADLVRGYVRARRLRRVVVPLRVPGGAAAAIRAGANLALAPERALGQRTWEDYLAACLR
jgi:uncharacterized protein YbjT (DUF2867 family)